MQTLKNLMQVRARDAAKTDDKTMPACDTSSGNADGEWQKCPE